MYNNLELCVDVVKTVKNKERNNSSTTFHLVVAYNESLLVSLIALLAANELCTLAKES